MEFKHTLEILYNQTEEIAGIAAKLQSGDDIRKIEIDLLLEKLRNVYDLASDIRATIHFREDTGPDEDLSPADKSVPIDEEEGSAEPVFEVKDTVHGDQAGRRSFQEDHPSEKEPAQDREKAPEIRTQEKDSAEEALSDRTKGPSGRTARTLNEEISERTRKEDVASQYKLSPIASITSAMGINERFELINELFGGDKGRFDETMDFLNHADSFVEAYNYLEQNFEWNMENAYVQRLLELIRRKLIVRRNE